VENEDRKELRNEHGREKRRGGKGGSRKEVAGCLLETQAVLSALARQKNTRRGGRETAKWASTRSYADDGMDGFTA